MFTFRQNAKPRLPDGFLLETKVAPTPEALNRLLARCNEDTYPRRRLALALKQSVCNLSVLDQSTGKLYGFVRATCDRGLNANLWNLVAEPGDKQKELLAVLVHSALVILRRDMPGCSVSVLAPSIAIKALQQQGFLLDPGGIRAMTFRLR